MTFSPSDLGGLSIDEKRQYLRELLLKKAGEGAETFPLSYGQWGLWMVQRLSPACVAYNIHYAAWLDPPTEINLLQEAFNLVLRRYPSLRTTFSEKQGEPFQVVRRDLAPHFEIIPALGWGMDRLETRISAEADRIFDLEHGPLLRVFIYLLSANRQVIQIVAHHIAVDFWSLDLLVRGVRDAYGALVSGRVLEEAQEGSSFKEFVAWQRSFLESEEGQRQRDYWKRRLGGEIPALNLPGDHPRPPVQTYSGRSIHFDLSGSLARDLREFAKREKTTLYTVLLAAYQVLLARCSGQEDILVGSPMAGRTHPRFETAIGCFVNPVVLRAHVDGDVPFVEFLDQVRRSVLDAIAHQDFPFALLVEDLRVDRDPSRTPLYQASFVWDRPRLYGAGLEVGFRLETLSSGQRGAPFDLTLTMVEVEGRLEGILQFNTDLFEDETIRRFAEHYVVLLGEIAARPDCLISELPLLSAEERQRLLVEWNDTEVDFPRHLCLHQVIEDQAARTPGAPALIYKEQSFSYFELNFRANQLAHYLMKQGIGPETAIGISVPRSPEMIVAILGALKAGGAYVPIDPDDPPERLNFMLKDARARAVLSVEAAPLRAANPWGRIILLDRDWVEIAEMPGTNPGVKLCSDNLAYIIYTSGSTGKPKGVMLPHRALMNYLWWAIKEYQVAGGSGVPVHTPVRFDLTVTSLFAPLMVGNVQILVPEEAGVEGLAKVILESEDLTLLKLTPAHMKVLEPLLTGRRLEGRIRTLVIGGEALFSHHLAFWKAAAPAMRLINEYGPTEAAVGCCVFDAQSLESLPENIPIGRPIANTQLYVLDKFMQPVPIGVVGELYIGGESLAHGYFNQSDLTAEKFVPNPFADSRDRLYKTGDLARFLPDGNLEYMGRTDDQVKIRGFRIELGEIEAALLQCPSVRETLVLAQEGTPGERRLIAYVVPPKDCEPNVSEIRAFLRHSLPEYMIPSSFLFLDSFPLTSHGKVNRKALPEPDGTRPFLEKAYVPPRTLAEQVLAGIWAEVLGIDSVGMHDSFFDLGGASIQSLDAASRAAQAGFPLKPEMIFQYPTIADLAAVLEGEGVPDASGAPEEALNDPNEHAPASAPAATIDPTEPPSGASRTHTTTVVGNTLIESLGVYLPEKVATTQEVLDGCRNRIDFPLEKMTGIQSRRVVGENEFSLDLAKKAVEDCLFRSRYTPDEIDLLICCNISRQNGPGCFSFEPSGAVRLKHFFGLANAVPFDISNACAGMFTGIQIADCFLRNGSARCALVVSGEYVSHLAETAQKEIQGFMDPRLACLTVGDAGAALVLHLSEDSSCGFHVLDLFTLGKYSSLCIAKASDQEHGGAIMVTDSIRQTAVALRQTVAHAAYVLRKGAWQPGDFQHVIMHQTSETALRDAMREINATLKQTACHEGNTIINLRERGNTASTSHFVAVYDRMARGEIRSGDSVVFGITGSGQVIGTALYTFDDLPQRFQVPQASLDAPRTVHKPRRTRGRRVSIESFGAQLADPGYAPKAIALAKRAAEVCLDASAIARDQIDLIIHAGVYRDEFLSEPALASILAGDLKINAEVHPLDGKHTLTFDILNGGLGFLNACYVASQMISSGKYRNVLVTVSEIENNRGIENAKERGVMEIGSCALLTADSGGGSGFGAFTFRTLEDPELDLATYSVTNNGRTFLEIKKPIVHWESVFQRLFSTIEECLSEEDLDLSSIKWVFPPQGNPDLVDRLSHLLGVERTRFVTLSEEGRDYFTSSIPVALQQAKRSGMTKPGDTGLLIGMASGFQAACAVYYF